MKNKTIYQVMAAALVSFAMFGYAHAQTATTTATGPVTDFKKELADSITSVANDPTAQALQQEIKNDDEDVAGDTHGDAKEIEGETDQDQIDSEIDQEAEGEDATAPEATSGGSTSSETNTSTEGN